MKTIASIFIGMLITVGLAAQSSTAQSNADDAKELATLRRENSNLQVQVRILNQELARVTKELKEATAPSPDPFAAAPGAAPAATADPFTLTPTEVAHMEQVHREEMVANAITIELKIIQVLDNGVLASGNGSYQRQTITTMVEQRGTGLDSHKMVVAPLTTRKPCSFELAFIECPSGNVIDGQTVTTTIYPAGKYSYSNTLGAQKTVLKFTTNP